MYCNNCKFYHSGYTENSCDLLEAYCFRSYTKDNPCAAIDDNYVILEDCEPLGLVKGKQLN